MFDSIGFIGLGAIGRPMAVHLVRERNTVVWNRTASVAADFARETGARVAASPEALIAQVDAVVTCLTVSSDVMEVVKSAGSAWTERHLLVDATSGDPTGSRQVSDYLAQSGAGFVDAPVSGGTSGAEAGTVTVMLGGEEPWIARARNVVAPYSGKVEHVGPVGAAHALKAINNALLAINIQAGGEGLAALMKFGVKADVALDVINASSGRSNVTENLFPERVLTRAWPRTFRLALLDKDVGVALKVLEDAGVPGRAFAVAKEEFGKGRAVLGEEADHVELVKLIEQAAGVEIR